MSMTHLLQPPANAVPSTVTGAVQRECACGGTCAECAAGDKLSVQPKLTLNTPGDRYEQEADRVAERVVSGRPAGAISSLDSGGPQRQQAEEDEVQLQRQTEEGEEEEEALQSKAAGTPAAPKADFASRLSAEAAGGRGLDSATRADFEPRFGRDLSHVRLHDGGTADRLSHEIGARAFTHRNHIYFAANQLDPRSSGGRRLLAHEITHTFQQDGGSTLRRACTPAATCSGGPVAGSAGRFNAEEESAEDAARRRRRAMTPARARSTSHAGRAGQLETFFRGRNAGLLAEVHGIFIDADMGARTAAYTFGCADFLAESLPSGDPDPSGFATATQPCVFVPGVMNREAYRFNSGDSTIAGQARDDWARETEAVLTHETTHAFFDEDIEPVLPRPSGVTTATCTDAAVENELSEIVAMLSEFPLFFEAAKTEASPTGPHHRRLTQYFDDIMDIASGESVPGALKQMGCRCDCNEVDLYVVDRVSTMTISFTAAQKTALRAELRRRLPAASRPSWPDTPRP